MSAERERDIIARSIYERRAGRFPTFANLEGEGATQAPTKINAPLARAWATACAEQAFIEADVFLEERARRRAKTGTQANARPKKPKKPQAPKPDPSKPVIV